MSLRDNFDHMMRVANLVLAWQGLLTMLHSGSLIGECRDYID
jgi:hypothetical protein